MNKTTEKSVVKSKWCPMCCLELFRPRADSPQTRSHAYRWSRGICFVCGVSPLTRLPAVAATSAPLVEELIRIGRPWKEGQRHHPYQLAARGRVREIGALLHDSGGMNGMRAALFAVRDAIGGVHAAVLESTWDGVGEWLG